MITVRRIPFGLDRLPRGFTPDDMRVPGAVIGAEKLRLNSEPVPPDAMPLAIGGHAARVAAAGDWLHSLCGQYAPLQRQFISCYLAFVAAHLAANQAAAAARLQRYQGLYAPEDFLWSALRPLPRAWLQAGDRWLPADIGFWDGAQVLAIELAPRPTEREHALRQAGISVLRLAPASLTDDELAKLLPASFLHFWEGQTLPSSPFRRAIPRGVL